MTASYYPIALSLQGRTAVVIADGALADEKVRALLRAGAVVRVIAEASTPLLDELAASETITLHVRTYRTGDLDGASIAIAAPRDRTLNRAIHAEAEASRVLLNAVDDVPYCHFIAPAIVRRGPITVAVSTSGTSPALASHLKHAIRRVVRREHGRFAALLGALRPEVTKRIPDPERRKRLWTEIVASGALRLIARKRGRAARTVVGRLIDAAATGVHARVAPRGHVTLVGAGPGRPGLVTVAGLRALRRADVVLYDRLASRALLRAAPPHAELIAAGKQARGQRVTQEWINETLVRHARCGRRVVRLKGGDPFVFGRGGEECAALRNAGVRYRVIPGVTSAVAAASAAGIPVTHRGVASAFVVVTAEQAASHADQPDWTSIARIPTIVVMMGLAQLRAVAARLRDAGLGDDTPCAIVAAATLRSQRTAIGTLATIADLAAAASIASPATLVIGHVVPLGAAAAPIPQLTDILQ